MPLAVAAWALALWLAVVALAHACDDDPIPDLPAPAARLNDDADAPPLPPEFLPDGLPPEEPVAPAGSPGGTAQGPTP